MLFFPFFRLNCGFIGFWVMKVFVSFFFSPLIYKIFRYVSCVYDIREINLDFEKIC